MVNKDYHCLQSPLIMALVSQSTVIDPLQCGRLLVDLIYTRTSRRNCTGKGTEYCDEHVCLSVCLLVRSQISKTMRTAELHRPGSVLLWRRCDNLYTFGFADDDRPSLCFIACGQWARIKHDVMFRRSSPGGGTSWTSGQLQCLVEFIRMWHREQSLLSRPTIDLFIRKVNSDGSKTDCKKS